VEGIRSIFLMTMRRCWACIKR